MSITILLQPQIGHVSLALRFSCRNDNGSAIVEPPPPATGCGLLSMMDGVSAGADSISMPLLPAGLKSHRMELAGEAGSADELLSEASFMMYAEKRREI